MILTNVIRMEQRGIKLFIFPLSGNRLLEISKVEHFGVDEKGVNRKFDYRHSKKLFDYMTQPGAHLFEPFLGDIGREWQWSEKEHTLTSQSEAHLSIDDAQHRLAALSLLLPEDIATWNFLVLATKGLAYKERLKIFNQQRLRKKIDPRLALQIMDKTNTFPDEKDKRAYELLKKLHYLTHSPLYQNLLMEELQPKKKIPTDEVLKLKGIISNIQQANSPAARLRSPQAYKLNIVSLMGYCKRLMFSPHSPLYGMSLEMQYRVVRDYLNAAQEVWTSAWNNPRACFLRRYHGIAALLDFLTFGIFKEEVEKWNKSTYKKLLQHGAKFDWSYTQFKGVGMPDPRQIQVSLNKLINDKILAKRKG